MTKLERLQALEREATKGPWVWDEDGDLMALWELEPCDGDIVLGMYTGDKPEPADAALIAALRNAAPDLIQVTLAAQTYMSHHSLDNAEALEVAVAALLESEAEA